MTAVILALLGVFAAAASRGFRMVLRPTAGHEYWAPVAVATRGFEAAYYSFIYPERMKV